MRIAIIGKRLVGLMPGPCFSKFGSSVMCVDNHRGNIKRINQGEINIDEPVHGQLPVKNMRARRLSFSTDLAAAAKGVDAVLVATDTA